MSAGSDLISVVVADDALILGKAQLAALICGQSESGQEARSQSVDWGIVIGNYRDRKATMTSLLQESEWPHNPLTKTSPQAFEWSL